MKTVDQTNITITEIAERGAKIYGEIKSRYEPQENGKFLAIEVASKNVYLGNSSAEALTKAWEQHPDKVFYVVKIGFAVAETLAQMLRRT